MNEKLIELMQNKCEHDICRQGHIRWSKKVEMKSDYFDIQILAHFFNGIVSIKIENISQNVWYHKLKQMSSYPSRREHVTWHLVKLRGVEGRFSVCKNMFLHSEKRPSAPLNLTRCQVNQSCHVSSMECKYRLKIV